MSRPSRTVRLGVIAALLASGSLPAGAVGARGAGRSLDDGDPAASPATTSAAGGGRSGEGGPVKLVTVDSSPGTPSLADASRGRRPVATLPERHRSVMAGARRTGTVPRFARTCRSLAVRVSPAPARGSARPGVISCRHARTVAGTATRAARGPGARHTAGLG